MQVMIRGHQTDVVSRWKSHIFDRLSKLSRFEERIIKMDIVLTASHHHMKGNETCHIFVKVPRKTINVKKGAENMLAAIDLSFKVLEKQVHDLWKDVKTRNRHDKAARLAKRNGALAL